MEDSRIIELFFERSEQAISELSEKYGAMCLKIAENITGSKQDAEECVNDAYLGVWEKVPPERPDSLAGYVCRITRNIAVKKYRSNTAQKRSRVYDEAFEELCECISSPGSVEDEFAAAELTRNIESFLETLDKKSRVMFVRRYWYSDTVEQISELFGISRHAVSVRLSRIRGKLKKHLAGKGVTL